MIITKETLAKLSHPEKDEIILSQHAEIQALKIQTTDLAAAMEKLKGTVEDLQSEQTKKTSKNSSVPPSKDQKANKPAAKKDKKKKKKRKNRPGPGSARNLHPNPHEVKDIFPDPCACGHEFTTDESQPYHEFDHIDIPPIEAKVTRYRLHKAKCQCCGEKKLAQAPEGISPYKPFGPRLTSLLAYQRFTNYVSYERLQLFCKDILNLDISEGAIVNIMKRSEKLFTAEVEKIKQGIRESDIIESDETSCRVHAQRWWEWIFHNAQYCLHVIRNSRGANVVKEVMAGHIPKFWASDLYSAQKGHGVRWQICLAHQLRDCQYAIDGGDSGFSWRVQRLFLRAIKLGKNRGNVKEPTRKAQKRRMLKELDNLLDTVSPLTKEGENLKRRYTQHRNSLFTFFDDVRVEPTNNGSERGLRPGVIFRKVTNCFRSEWGVELYAAVRSVIGTGKRRGQTGMQSIQAILVPATSNA